MMNTEPQFFFGGTSRPVMIRLSKDFTLFSGRFCDCTGLSLMQNDDDSHSGLNLRTPNEVRGLTHWMRHLPPPSLKPGCHQQTSWIYPAFSPEFEEESIPADGAFTGYDATELSLSAVWRNDREEGLCLHLEATELDGLGVQGVPLNLITRLCDALERFADEWETHDIDLTLDQPLAHIPAP